jgi:hypothetical protein
MGDVVEIKVGKVDTVRRQLLVYYVKRIAEASIPNTRLDRRKSKKSGLRDKGPGGKGSKNRPRIERKKRRR